MAGGFQICSIGKLVGEEEDCHESATDTLLRFDSLKQDDREKILFRTGLLQQKEKVETLCSHHKKTFLVKFEFFEKHCCDPLNRHECAVHKDLRPISLATAKQLSKNDIELIPGKKLCSGCRKRLNTLAKTDVPCTSTSYQPKADTNNQSTDSEGSTRSDDLASFQLNKTLSIVGESPLKLHSMHQHSRAVYKKRKLTAINEYCTKKMAIVMGTPADGDMELPTEFIDKDRSIQDYSVLMKKIKEKVATHDMKYSEKVRLLTCAPTSWSKKEIAEYFQVPEYSVRKARELEKTRGIFSKPQVKKGRGLSAGIKERVIQFYCDNNNTRIMPGAKDKVSIVRNVHEQKRLILCTLKELYQSFKGKYSDIKIGFSLFSTLRPKWCVLAGSPGTHAVCVCTIHQNVILMLKCGHIEKTYKELIGMMSCETGNKDCMLQRCTKCPNEDLVKEYLENQFADTDDDITFNQWVTTDRTEMITQVLPISEYISLLVQRLVKLKPHSFITKQQSEYFTHRKQSLGEGHVICLMDFSENYSFHVQDEAQGYHWTHRNCTVHPVVCYYMIDGTLSHSSLCFLSKDLTHDVPMVYEIQKKVICFLKTKLTKFTRIEYFTDGCAAQYKNCKNFLNLCNHQADFGIDAEWNFFATSHGKSACDGIGGVVKRLTALESIRRPHQNQIINLEQMLEFCRDAIPAIYFEEITQQCAEAARLALQQRFVHASTIKGTRGFHYFRPLSCTKIAAKRTSFDHAYAYVTDFLQPSRLHQPSTTAVKLDGYVAAIYDGLWYVGVVLETDRENGDVQIRFLAPNGPSKAFYFPKPDNVCWLPLEHILVCIESPTQQTVKGTYEISEETFENISVAWEEFREAQR